MSSDHLTVWDYVIVGAGSAGCVLANYLSESGSKRVLLLEAGPRAPLVLKSIASLAYLDLSRFDWHYHSQPDPTRGLRAEHWPRGRVVGGTSSINGMNFVRGSAGDYDRWAALGNVGWAAKDVMPIFKSLERCERGVGDTCENGIRGRAGRLPVRQVKSCHPLTEAFLKAAQAAGHRFNADYNGAAQEGVGYAQLNQRRGFRCSAADAFLKDALRRPNLQIQTDATVYKVLIANRRVSGVRFEVDGSVREVRANQVILSAGAINTPKLLMLSGIGDPPMLKASGLDVLVDRPTVGRNLMEHPAVELRYRATRPTYNPTEGLMQKARFVAKMLLTGQGPLASVVEAQAFLKTSSAEVEPDVQIHFMLVGAANQTEQSMGLVNYPAFTVLVNKSHPASRGQIRVATSDPNAPPIIDPNLLADDSDALTLVKGVDTVRRIMVKEPIASMVVEELLPGPGTNSPTKVASYVRANTGLAYHPAGTCRMGADELAVVTPELQVRDIEGLWVADASIMPTLISGNINAACMMIGAKLGRQLQRGEG